MLSTIRNNNGFGCINGIRFASGGSYDVVVVGGGPGGYVASLHAAKMGLKVACVEQQKTLGGTCLNVGCIPSKCLLHASEMYEEVRNKKKLSKFGVETPSDLSKRITMDVGKMIKYKNGVVAGLTGSIAALFKKSHIDLINGRGSLTERRGEVSIESSSGHKDTIQAKNIILASGSIPVELPFARYDEQRIISSTGALALQKTPKHLVIIGAGIIGLELGTVWKRLGADVTVVEFLDRVAPGTDGSVAKLIQRTLQRQGMKFHLKTKVSNVEKHSNGVTVHAHDVNANKDIHLDADCVLVCVGRRPATANMGLERAGIKLERGRVVTDKHYRTGVPGVYAIGDIVEGPMLAHKAEEEGFVVSDAIARGTLPNRIRFDTIPGVLYTKPEVAWVGMSTETAKAKKIPIITGQFQVRGNGRARSIDDIEGFAKIIAHKNTKQLLGVHIVGPQAGEMLAGCTLALEQNLKVNALAESMFSHPTVSEIIKEAALATIGSAIHA